MSKPALAVDADALRSMAATLATRADVIAKLDPSGPGQHAAGAMTATATGVAATEMADPVTRAYAAMAATLRDMSTTANASANDYEATDRGFADLLARYEAGVG